MRNRTLIALLLFSISASAQNTPSPGTQPAYFIYATGERSDNKLKVMLISSHIFLGEDHVLPQSNIEVALSLDFNRIEDKVEEDERYFPNDYDNITSFRNEVRDVHGTSLNWNLNWRNFDQVTTSDNSLTAMEKIRTSVIEEYRVKGYKVYQVDFRPDYQGENSSGYKYYSSASLSYKTYSIERVLPLSPLYIPYYRQGEIKSMLASIGSSLDSHGSSGSIVIEDKKETQKNNVTEKQKEKEEDDPGKWERLAQEHMWESAAIETRADSMYKLGALFFPSALELYQQAYTLYPSPRVQMKIDNINGYMALGKAFNQLAEGVDNGVAKLDPEKKTRFMHMSITYSGMMGSYNKITNAQDQDPMSAFFSFTGHRTFFSIEFRFGYMETPVYEYNVAAHDLLTGMYLTGEKVKIQQQGAALGMSIGMNIPMKNLVAYAMYGADAILINAGSGIRSEGYSLDEQPTYPWATSRFTFGMTYHIPKTNVGFGVHYNLNTIQGDDDGASKVRNDHNPNENYYLKSTTSEKYKYNNAGISFSWGFNR
ncbi:MAG: hypothetical protein ACJ75F_07390 [Flavisolibacter sp.]